MLIVDSVKRLLRRGALSHLKKIINKTHAADLSQILRYLSLPDQRKIFNLIEDVEQKGILFSEMDESTLLSFIDGMQLDEIVHILENMPTDDVADLIAKLPRETSDAILEKMKKEGSEEIEGLLTYDDDTAGGIMVPDFIAIKEDTTAKEVIQMLQKGELDVEMPFYLYVVDEYDRLIGVSSLRQLVVVRPDTPLKDFMTTEVFSVRTDVDQEVVAKMVARYDVLAVPVVDDTNKLVGIVTVDDVIDIFRAEATEDMLRMAGVAEDYIETRSVFGSTRVRLPWLFASCIGGIIAFVIINQFETSLQKVAALAAFIPVIMGMGGNIGTQTSTIVVRGLATGRINKEEFWPVIFKELCVGLILGCFYGSLIALVAQFQYSMARLALAVGLAVVSSMSIAALTGSLVPLVFEKMGTDPAVATGPFVTTSIDIVSVYFYFQISTILLGL